MTAVLAVLLAAAIVDRWRRLELVARAGHELRGPATALSLAAESLSRQPALREHADALRLEVERMEAGLADLDAARRGRRAELPRARLEFERFARAALPGRAVRWRWRGGPVSLAAPPGRLAQAIGNLVANAAEHGAGPVSLDGRRTPGGGARIEVRNRRRPRPVAARPPARRAGDRGRGLRIARSAVRAAGGRLDLSLDGDEVVAALQLPPGGERAA